MTLLEAPPAGTRYKLTEAFVERLFGHLDVGECWVWTKALTDDGYGRVICPDRKVRRVHRVVWELLVGPLTAEEVLDHQCRTRACANPDHFDVTDNPTNTARGKRARMTHCARNHPLSGGNLRLDRDGRRHCVQCKRDGAAARRARKREKA